MQSATPSLSRVRDAGVTHHCEGNSQTHIQRVITHTHTHASTQIIHLKTCFHKNNVYQMPKTTPANTDSSTTILSTYEIYI